MNYVAILFAPLGLSTPTLTAPGRGTEVSPTLDRLRSLVQQRDLLLRDLVTERRSQRNGRPARDMLDVLLDAGLPEEDVLYTLVDLFVAGVNTVAMLLLSYYCALHVGEPVRGWR